MRTSFVVIHLVLQIFILTISQAKAQATSSHLVFNLTGSKTGYGDVTGPLWILLDLRRYRPDDIFTVVLDKRAKSIIENLYDGKSTDTIGKEFNLNFITKSEASKIAKADYAFELFFGGRKINDFTKTVYNKTDTVTFISDTMHNPQLNEIREGNNHIYYKPPGVGEDRSGIINNPDIFDYQGKSLPEKRKLAAEKFQDDLLKQIILKDRFPETRQGFIYGVHNESFKRSLIGQTQAYLNKLKELEQPVLIFTPNSVRELKKVIRRPFGILSRTVKILDLPKLHQLDNLKPNVYVVSLGPLSSKQFTALMATSETPVLIEGNSTVSSALRMGTPFLLFRSWWNTPQIHNIIETEAKYLQTDFFAEIYKSPENWKPNFYNVNLNKNTEKFIKALAIRIPDFSKKMNILIDLIEQEKLIKANFKSQNEIAKKYLELSENFGLKTGDEILEYSFILNAYENGFIDLATLNRVEDRLHERGIDTDTLGKRLIPTVPSF